MKLLVAGKPFWVDFQHRLNEEHPWGFGLTRCVIRLDPGATVVGSAYRGSSDRWSRAKGRKIAFTKAIGFFPRDERRDWWKAYYEAFPKEGPKEMEASKPRATLFLPSPNTISVGCREVGCCIDDSSYCYDHDTRNCPCLEASL